MNRQMNESEERIRKLEDELYMARETIIELMPEKTQKILSSYYSCKSSQEIRQWRDSVVEHIIGLAEPLPDHISIWQHRAICPLCGGSSTSAYSDGFTLPEGLRRHLIGFGNVRQCSVMEAVFKQSRNYRKDEFLVNEQQEQQEKDALLAKRRQNETLYQLSPFREPELIDGSGWTFDPARNQEQLDFALARLKLLGFQLKKNQNIHSWVDDKEEFVVYADPRKAKKINFEVWEKPLPKKTKHFYLNPHRSFYIMDSWKNDIKAKYDNRLRESREKSA